MIADRLARALPAVRSNPGLSIDAWIELMESFSYAGFRYTLPGATQEEIGSEFVSRCRMALKSNGVVFACMAARMLLFQEARFQFRELTNGRPGNFFGGPGLGVLEHPWKGATTGDLLGRGLQYADIVGNSFIVRRPGPQLRFLRPDWVTMVLGSQEDDAIGAWDADCDVLGYIYEPGGKGSGRTPVTYLASDVAHFAPFPDPEAQFRGMSWLTPVLREVMADKAMTDHKLNFTQYGATPNMAVKMDVDDVDKMQPWINKFKEQHEGATNAYKTLFLGAGMDATVIGANLRQMDFKTVQGAGETRIAAAARVPPIIVGLSEGLEAATYSNYGQARRAFADLWARPYWRIFCGSLEPIINLPEPSGGEVQLWYDDRDIPFLMEDQTDSAEVLSLKMAAINQAFVSGFDPMSAVDAIDSGDLSRLKHTGLTSVQAQGGQQPPQPSKPPTTTPNGKPDAVPA